MSRSWPWCIYSLPFAGLRFAHIPPSPLYHHATSQELDERHLRTRPTDEWFSRWQTTVEHSNQSTDFPCSYSWDARNRVPSVRNPAATPATPSIPPRPPAFPHLPPHTGGLRRQSTRPNTDEPYASPIEETRSCIITTIELACPCPAHHSRKIQDTLLLPKPTPGACSGWWRRRVYSGHPIHHDPTSNNFSHNTHQLILCPLPDRTRIHPNMNPQL
jgi:hypothetical protein